MFIQPTNSQQKNFSSLSSSALTVMCFRLTLVLLCVLTCSVTGFAQWNVSNTAGSTPSGIAPGAPAGTYPLSGFEQMNYFNGNLNVTLPLLKVGGRGGAQFTIPLNVRTHPWRVEGAGTPISNSNTVCYTYFAENNWWQPVDPKPNYGAGIMTTRLPGQGVVFDQNSQQYYNSAVRARLTFSAPDGTEYDFYDQLFGGGTQSAVSSYDWLNFGKVFIATQNAQVTFISDADIGVPSSTGDWNGSVNGWLYMADGTRYRIDSGQVKRIIDRNGNKIVFTHDTSGRVATITDSLNRVVTFAYNVNMGGVYGIGDLITYTGFGGAARYLRVTRTTLSNALRTGYAINTNLFPQFPSTWTYNPNPSNVAKTLWLPDGRKYEFRYNEYGEVARVELPTGGASEYDWAAGVVNGPVSGAVGRWNAK